MQSNFQKGKQMKSRLIVVLALLTAFAVIMACSSKKVAEVGDTVKVHYVGKLDDGTIFDSSEGQEPLEFKLGDSMVIPGFEHALIGMSEGDSTTVTIPPDSAYGPYRDEMIGVVPRDKIQAAGDVQFGIAAVTDTQDKRVICGIADSVELHFPAGEVDLSV